MVFLSPFREKLAAYQSDGKNNGHEQLEVVGRQADLHGDGQAGLIDDEKQGKYIYYTLNTSVVDDILNWILDLKGERHEK